MSSGFIEKERSGSLATIERWKATLAACWRSACLYDGFDDSAPFVVFSDDNPFVLFLNRATFSLNEALESYRAFGYVGLTMQSGKAQLPSAKKREK